MGWIKHIYVHRYVDIRVGNSFLDLGNDPVGADFVDSASSDQIEAAADIVAEVIFWSHNGCSNASVDGCVLDETLRRKMVSNKLRSKTLLKCTTDLLMSNMQEGSMVEASSTIISLW